MITLYNFGPGFGLPEVSPYCMKTEIQLKMAGLAYRKEEGGYPKAPKGKLPYISDEGELVADSTFIRAHILKKYGIDLDQGLDDRQRAEAWAVERMLEDHLEWGIGYMRWCLPMNFAKGPAHFFDGAPEEIRAKLVEDTRLRVVENMRAHGIGRHKLEEIVELGGKSLASTSTLLGDNAYLTGALVSGADATALGVLASNFTPFFESPLRERALEFGNLGAYVDRMMAQFYPEHAWVPVAGVTLQAQVA